MKIYIANSDLHPFTSRHQWWRLSGWICRTREGVFIRIFSNVVAYLSLGAA